MADCWHRTRARTWLLWGDPQTRAFLSDIAVGDRQKDENEMLIEAGDWGANPTTGISKAAPVVVSTKQSKVGIGSFGLAGVVRARG